MLKKVILFEKCFSRTNNFNQEQNEIKMLQEQVNKYNQAVKVIQSKFDFDIPSYLIDEITNGNYSNLNCLINCAVINKRLSKENGEILKQAYNV